MSNETEGLTEEGKKQVSLNYTDTKAALVNTKKIGGWSFSFSDKYRMIHVYFHVVALNEKSVGLVGKWDIF